MLVSSATRLKDIRSGLRPKVSQESMARRAGITLQTYNHAENGSSVRYVTAEKILAAINEELRLHGLEPVSLDDLMLHLY